MCGIAGFTWADRHAAERMGAALAHRGPDQSGLYVDDAVSLAHRRLSIIDLSPAGRQPLANEDGSLQLVFNGEIYGFAALRRELEGRGHRFRSGSDAEVVLHAYEEHGDACVQRLQGMFAFALWDRRRRRLLLARDRLGIKPLYWAPLGDGLLFASEIKAILEEPRVARAVDPQALYQFLGWEFVPAPRTLFAGIHKLPPGCTLVWDERRGAIEIAPYWELSMAPVQRAPREHAAALLAGLSAAVASHLVADVPVGVLLSGGLDSSALAALMHRQGAPVKAFSLYYPEASYSELDHARAMARAIGAEHHELRVEAVTAADLERAVWHLDEPMTDLSAVPFLLVCRQVREHVKVCLSGEGGDEILAGYDRFRASRIHRGYAHLPEALRRHAIAPLVGLLPDSAGKKGVASLLQRFVAGGLLAADGGHLRWQYFLPPEEERALLSDGLRGAIDADPFAPLRACLRRCPEVDPVNRECFADTRFFLPDSPLMKVDKLSMASALEVRVPFLDHRLVELVAGMPGSAKLHGLTTKRVLREAMRGILPERIRRRGKQGYSLPVKHWLRGSLRELLADTLASSPLVRETFRRPRLEALQREHLAGHANHSHLLWGILNLALWHRQYLEQPRQGLAALAAAAPRHEPTDEARHAGVAVA